jgi:hypothetical protein
VLVEVYLIVAQAEEAYIDPAIPPPFLILPYKDCKERLGIDQTVATPDDMMTYDAYWRLWTQFKDRKEQWLEQTDFKNQTLYYKYFLLSLGLMEYPMVLIGGDVGKGKSLIRSALSFWMMKLFNKVGLMDSPPPNPELYGQVHCLYDQEYVNLIVDDLARLNKLDKDIAKCTDIEERKVRRLILKEQIKKMVLYNAIGSYDESHMWGDCSRRYNLTVLIHRISMIRRHLFMGMLFNYVNPRRADKLIWEPHTHEIECFKDGFPELGPGYCNFQITDIRPGGTGVSKWIHLKPAQWEGYWDSENIPTVVHDIDIYLGGKKKAKPTKADWDEISPSLKE